MALKGGFEEMVKKMSVRARTMPNQMTARSAHRVLIATVVCCVFLLSGCGFSTPLAQYVAVKNQSQSQQQPASSQADQPKTLGEVLEAGTGDFDSNSSGFVIFNPCTEIGAEQYAEIGLFLKEELPTTRNDFSACSLRRIDPQQGEVSFTIGSDALSYSDLESQGLILQEPMVKLPVGMYFQGYPNFNEELHCTVATSTNRGRISLTGIGNRLMGGVTRLNVCQQAVDKFQEFLNLKG
ncbi:MAG: DUF3558 family protein [Corynebacterium sp.]|uniref:DUF3558 family protein n=1 Tax=Corynebacterium sp. TaxID=1720 RepID=UPI0026DB3843|nr:DUF3558 family protein [Corynebacterium sp.]MDO5098279.1 DUF3558 family protein [Corynebacterium sp.]